jgi:O-antigen/teichoic acid export membrane protein
MAGISITSVIQTQLDKMILVKILPLDTFGYYSLASRAAGGLIYLTGPVCAAFFPRFSQLVTKGDTRELVRLYHRSCQLLSVLIIPPAVVLTLFSYELLLVWTQDRSIAENSHLMLSLLTVGTALNGMASPPYALQLASGWTRLSLIFNTAATLLQAPLIYIMSVKYGGVGAAMVWVIFNALYILVALYLMHRRLLRGELLRWYHLDIGRPLVAAAAVGSVWKWLVPFPDAVWLSLLNLILVSVATLGAAVIAAPEIRTLATRWLTPPRRSGRNDGTD